MGAKTQNKEKCAEMGTLYNHILNHNLTVITLIIAAVRSAVMAAKRVWRIFWLGYSQSTLRLRRRLFRLNLRVRMLFCPQSCRDRRFCKGLWGVRLNRFPKRGGGVRAEQFLSEILKFCCRLNQWAYCVNCSAWLQKVNGKHKSHNCRGNVVQKFYSLFCSRDEHIEYGNFFISPNTTTIHANAGITNSICSPHFSNFTLPDIQCTGNQQCHRQRTRRAYPDGNDNFKRRRASVGLAECGKRCW